VNLGISFVRIRNRVGSGPVQGSRYLRSTVIVSSPEIESSRSTAVMLSTRVPRRASEITANGLPRRRDVRLRSDYGMARYASSRDGVRPVSSA